MRDQPTTDERADPGRTGAEDLAVLDLVRVLVVEDDAKLRTLARMVLEDAGCRVAVVADGHEALASATSFPPDIVLLDVHLPGTSGREVARTLQWDPATTPMRFVVVTGSSSEAEVLRDWEVVPDAILEKPYDPPALVDAVLRAALRGRAAQRPSG